MNCRLCIKNPAIKNSHVVSKFIWKLSGVIGAQRKFDAYCISQPELSQKNLQDGFKEPILCSECEGKRSTLERIARKQLFSKVRSLDLSKGGAALTGLDSSPIKLFTMFQLWMMGVAKNDFYSHVQLGPHEEQLRNLLLTNDPSYPWRYGTTLAVQQIVATNRLPANSQKFHDNPIINLEIGARSQAACGSTLTFSKPFRDGNRFLNPVFPIGRQGALPK